ncbi:MAG TPA: alpha-amylase family glycosyl hydrolase [Longimicrobiales bacterium]
MRTSAKLLLLLCVFTATCAPARVEAPTPADRIGSSAIYEVFVRDFSPSGDFRGVIDGLDRIEATGSNVVWLMPIHPVGVANRKGSLGSSYSIRDYTAVNPEYGTMSDFRALVDAVHARGMRIIIDWVPNHTAWDNRWLTQHPDWYTRNAAGEITEPLNDDGSSTGWTDVADLNYGNPAMRRAMLEAMRFWLEEQNVDGFRVDVAGWVPDDFWEQAVPQLRQAGADILLAEWADPKMNRFGFDLTYGWDGYHALKQVWRDELSAADFVRRELADAQAVPFGSRLRFTTNHDETAWDEPPVLLFDGPAGARAAFAAIALLPGVPLLYNGQDVESPQQLGLFEREAIEWDRPGAAEARAWYRRVVELARTDPDFDGGALAAVATTAPDDVIAYRRGADIVLVNAGPDPVRFEVTDADVDGARDLFGGGEQRGRTVDLTGYGVRVLDLDD